MAKINFFALGGQDEKGKNLFCIEINDQLFLFDCGIKYPEKDVLGIDMVIPNFKYLKDNKKKIKGLFLTNNSLYNSGAVGKFVTDFPNVNIYCSELSFELIKHHINRSKIKLNDKQFVILKNNDSFSFNDVKVYAFNVVSHIPNSFGFALVTEHGTIAYLGSSMVQANQIKGFSSDVYKIERVSKNGVLALILDSEYAYRKSFTMPSNKIEKFISTPMRNLNKRIIIGLFEEYVYNLYEIIKLAKEANRKIAIYGSTMLKIVQNKEVAKELNLKPGDLISTNDIKKYPNCCVILNFNGTALCQKLESIASDEDQNIILDKNDIVVVATPPVPGIERRHTQTLDELSRTEAEVIFLSDRDIYEMRASYEDIKLYLSILKPRYFIPIKGLYKNYLEAEKAAIEAGLKQKDVFLLNNGTNLTFTNNKLVHSNRAKIDTNDVYVNLIGRGDVSSTVLNERQQLATNGVLIIGVNIDAQTKEIVSSVDIQMRGLIYIVENSPIFKLLLKQVTDVLEVARIDYLKNKNSFDLEEVKNTLFKNVKNIVKQETGKRPIILIFVNEVNEK